MSNLSSDKLAIVGMGGLFPGANNPDEFWDALLQGEDLTEEIKVLEHSEFKNHRKGDSLTE